MRLNGAGRGGAGLGISHTRPAPFNFLNGTGMGIIFYKRGGVGMRVTRPEPAPLPFLIVRVQEMLKVIL